MQSAFPVQERPANNVLIAGSDCAKIMPSRVAHVSRFSADLPFLTSSAALEASTRGTSRAKKSLKLGETATSYLGLFPISQSHKLIQNFLQSLESPFLVCGCPSISPVHLRAVRFTDLGYFFPKFLDTF